MIIPVKYLFIKNKHLPNCINCKNYILPSKTYKNGRIINENGKCNVFGEKNLETGEIVYTDALISRLNEKNCTPHAVYFEEIVKLN